MLASLRLHVNRRVSIDGGLKELNSVRFGAMRRTIIPQAARIEEERQESVRQMVLEAQVRRFFLYVPLG